MPTFLFLFHTTNYLFHASESSRTLGQTGGFFGRRCVILSQTHRFDTSQWVKKSACNIGDGIASMVPRNKNAQSAWNRTNPSTAMVITEAMEGCRCPKTMHAERLGTSKVNVTQMLETSPEMQAPPSARKCPSTLPSWAIPGLMYRHYDIESTATETKPNFA